MSRSPHGRITTLKDVMEGEVDHSDSVIRGMTRLSTYSLSLLYNLPIVSLLTILRMPCALGSTYLLLVF